MNGKRKTENGKRKTENGKRKTENGKRRTENGERKTENGKRKTNTKDFSDAFLPDLYVIGRPVNLEAFFGVASGDVAMGAEADLLVDAGVVGFVELHVGEAFPFPPLLVVIA